MFYRIIFSYVHKNYTINSIIVKIKKLFCIKYLKFHHVSNNIIIHLTEKLFMLEIARLSYL